ncbi:LPS export ABC transporter permease LptG [Cellvibrio zantedeschiae]|uniref:LPS export ABC transporter permease LptG n=1 Tax=Cellvibrio zantedeschiae TaxID=1237077 RepID=A0ABQ3AWI2_9GAMM|nr:LPS export ABC transporter permease LptG [Cellvibrio zantedeschiae]GGY69054.1 LPS export ABC transporter permease LptG [Cellvibrio zantedeschiae]
MRKISRYVFMSVFNATALTLFVFIALFFIFTLIEQLQGLRGNYTALEALINVVLRIPTYLNVLIPFSCLVGCLAGLGALATSSELTIIRASGVSTKHILWLALRPTIVFMLLQFWVGEYVAPYSEQMAVNRKAIAQGYSVKQSQQKLWNHESNEFMHFNAVLPSGVIYGLSRYQLNEEHQLVAASFSKQAIYQGDHWQEEDVAITHLEADSTRIENTASRRWDTQLTPDLLNVLVLDPDNLSIRNLYYYNNYLRDQHIENNDYSLAFWKKALEPLATASLVLIAISFIFGPLRSVTMGQRVFTGVIVGLAFLIAQRLFGPSSLVFGFSPAFAVLCPILICIGIGLFLLRKAR